MNFYSKYVIISNTYTILEEEAFYLLITRHLSNQTSQEENEQLFNWISISKTHRQTFIDIKNIWTLSKPIDDGAVEAGLNKLHLKMENRHTEPRVRKNSIQKHYWIAASFIGFILIGILLTIFINVKNPEVVYIKQMTTGGEKKVIHLQDGTTIHMAPQSSIEYPEKFNSRNRIVKLEGEAYFEVSKQPHKPFIVQTKMLDVKVLGTHFNVNNLRRSTIVSLIEGRVKVGLSGKNHTQYNLIPGQQLKLNHINHRITQQPFDADDVIGWMTNTLIIKNETLSEAAEKIGQMYNVKIIFNNKEIAEKRLYATFNNESLTSVLETIKATGDVNYTINGNKIYLTLKKQKEK